VDNHAYVRGAPSGIVVLALVGHVVVVLVVVSIAALTFWFEVIGFEGVWPHPGIWIYVLLLGALIAPIALVVSVGRLSLKALNSDGNEHRRD
jgi:hypothetical protein